MAERLKKQRVANDYYPTPKNLVQALLNEVSIEGTVLKPCAGHGAIASHFPDCITNEPYPTSDFAPTYQMDATNPKSWQQFDKERIDWVVTNPPYGKLATPIVELALQYAHVGVAMLVRLNWLEPCRDRSRHNEQCQINA